MKLYDLKKKRFVQRKILLVNILFMVYFPAFEVETKNQLDIYDQSKKQNVRIKQSKENVQ